MREVLAVLLLFMAKTLINLPWVLYINPFVPLLAIYFYKKRSPIKITIISLSIFISSIILAGNVLLLALNYLIIFPIFLITADNFFQSKMIKILVQGTIAIIVFFVFRLFFLPAIFSELIRSIIYTEIFLFILTPSYKLFK